MPQNPPSGFPRVTPYLLYEDANAAVEWLCNTFGFSERSAERMTDEEGRVRHSALEFEDGLVLLGHPGPDYTSPRAHGHVCQLLYVYVDDVDAHHAHATSCGARILSAPEDVFYGDRRYEVEDLEGHRWNFASRRRDLAPEER